MKKLISYTALVLFLVLVVFLIFWAMPTRRLPPADIPISNDTYSTEACTSNEGSEAISESADTRYFDAYIELVEGGIYMQTIVEQRQIGGLSVPIKTVTYFGDGFINIIENEMHNISTEIFINARGAYYFNETGTEAVLMPASDAEIQAFPYQGLEYVTSGEASVGLNTYIYERYLTPEGETVDYLFSDGIIKRMKKYADASLESYELLTLELSEDISDARTSLPYGLVITDKT